MRTPGTTRTRSKGTAILSARLRPEVKLEAAGREIVAIFPGQSVSLGEFSAGVADRAQKLGIGLPFSSFVADGQSVDEEIEQLIRRLARHGLVEYRLEASPNGQDLVVIEPQVSEYWPRLSSLHDEDALVLSRFAYLRRRGNELVLESPRAEALFKICDPKVATTLAILSTPQLVKDLRRQDGLPGFELLALLLDGQVLLSTQTPSERGLRSVEGDDNLVLWDFHDLLFHARSTEGRHANPLGGLYLYAQTISPPPAVRAPWPGKKIALSKFSPTESEALSPVATVLRQRRSIRNFDGEQPILLDELARFLDGTAHILSEKTTPFEFGEFPPSTYTVRPYPSAGGCYELELYIAVDNCEGLARGFYHYDAQRHALVPIAVRETELKALLMRAAFAMGAPAAPQVLFTIAARFSRVSWKYSSIAYALILKDVGVLLQTFYMMATDMGLGGCAIGIANIDLFARMTGIEFHVEGPVGQFAIGRGTAPEIESNST
jgi:SagB-type dehydrogenase family enzyme